MNGQMDEVEKKEGKERQGERKIEAEIREPDNRNMIGELRKVRGEKKKKGWGEEVEVLVNDDTSRHQRNQREWRDLS